MTPHVGRRPREPDPLVSARLQAISYADPYVFVHANDVIDAEPFDETAPAESDQVGGWVPEPLGRAPASSAASTIPVAGPPPPVRPRPLWLEVLHDRLEPARNGVGAMVVLGLIAAAVAGFVYLRAQPSRPAVTTLPTRSPAVAVVTGGAAKSSPRVLLWVDVTGKVHKPGVVRLRSGSRVIDALRAAGGALAGTSLDSLNLAAPLTDGQQVAVGAPASAGSVGAAAGTGTGTAAAAAAAVNLNTATATELTTLPGIGPVLAQRILDYRAMHGPFASVEALRQVSGIGPSKYQDVKDHVTV